MADDRRLTDSLSGVDIPQSYAQWKKALKEGKGLDFTVDYNVTGIQYGRNPALNTEASSSWVLGLRARLYF